jgi:hypothetical protein
MWKEKNVENHDSRPLFLIGGVGCPNFYRSYTTQYEITVTLLLWICFFKVYMLL